MSNYSSTGTSPPSDHKKSEHTLRITHSLNHLIYHNCIAAENLSISLLKCLSKTISRVMSLNGHLSRPDVTTWFKRPTRKQTGRLMLSVRSCFEWGLHGPLLLPGERWSLTPPFHPYTGMPVRYISVALSLESPPPDVIWHPAL